MYHRLFVMSNNASRLHRRLRALPRLAHLVSDNSLDVNSVTSNQHSSTDESRPSHGNWRRADELGATSANASPATRGTATPRTLGSASHGPDHSHSPHSASLSSYRSVCTPQDIAAGWTTIVISIRDTGSGMDMDDINRLFQAFSRLERNQGQALGTGLGA